MPWRQLGDQEGEGSIGWVAMPLDRLDDIVHRSAEGTWTDVQTVMKRAWRHVAPSGGRELCCQATAGLRNRRLQGVLSDVEASIR